MFSEGELSIRYQESARMQERDRVVRVAYEMYAEDLKLARDRYGISGIPLKVLVSLQDAYRATLKAAQDTFIQR